MKIKHVCFDLNRTLISENTWLELNKAMGMTEEEDQHFFNLYQAGKLSYVNWQKELEKIYVSRGRAFKENIIPVVFDYTYNPGAKEVVNYLKSKGYLLSLLSGSIDLLVEKVAGELGIEYWFTNNKFVFDENDYLKEIKCLGDDSEVKVDQLKNLCQNLEVEVTETACVGDGDNDAGIFKLTGRGITFKDSKNKKFVWKEIEKLIDLKKLL